MSRHANTTKGFVAAALVCDLFGFCFSLIGIFGPAWLVTKDSQQQWRFYEGIWLARYCRNETCGISTREHAIQDILRKRYVPAIEEYQWTEFKVLSVFAIVGSLLAVVMTMIVLSKKSRNRYIPLNIIGGVSALSSCLFLLVPVLKLSAVDSKIDFIDYWAKTVAALGVFQHLMATIFQAFAVYQSILRYRETKRDALSPQRRLEMVARYVSSQCDNNLRASNTNSSQSNMTSGDLRTLRSDSVTDRRDAPFSGPSPYPVVPELPTYSEISIRY